MKNNKEYRVHRHTRDLVFETKLIKRVTRMDRLMSLVPDRVVHDFKNDPDKK